MAFAITDTDRYSCRIYFDGDGDEEYFCYCEPGDYDKVTLPIWRIKKLFYDTVGADKKLVAIKWANGDNRFMYIANDRASYSYT